MLVVSGSPFVAVVRFLWLVHSFWVQRKCTLIIARKMGKCSRWGDMGMIMLRYSSGFRIESVSIEHDSIHVTVSRWPYRRWRREGMVFGFLTVVEIESCSAHVLKYCLRWHGTVWDKVVALWHLRHNASILKNLLSLYVSGYVHVSAGVDGGQRHQIPCSWS